MNYSHKATRESKEGIKGNDPIRLKKSIPLVSRRG